MHLLDTSILSYYMEPDARNRTPALALRIGEIVDAFGIHLAAVQAADLHARAATARPAIVIADADLLIVSTALAHHMILVTSDRPLVERCRELDLGSYVEHVPVQ